MKSKFADFVRLVYGSRYQDYSNVIGDIKGMNSDLYLFDHASPETSDKEGSSK
jgi:hypothetical protein